MQERDTPTAYLSIVERRLRAGGYRLSHDVAHHNLTFECVARAKVIHFELLNLFETFFIFRRFTSIDATSLTEFCATCFDYCMKTRSFPFQPLIGGAYMSILCFPVAIIDGIDPTVSDYVGDATPPFHWFAGFELAVVCDVRSGLLHYSRKTPWQHLGVGPWYYWGLRRIVRKTLSP